MSIQAQINQLLTLAAVGARGSKTYRDRVAIKEIDNKIKANENIQNTVGKELEALKKDKEYNKDIYQENLNKYSELADQNIKLAEQRYGIKPNKANEMDLNTRQFDKYGNDYYLNEKRFGEMEKREQAEQRMVESLLNEIDSTSNVRIAPKDRIAIMRNIAKEAEMMTLKPKVEVNNNGNTN